MFFPAARENSADFCDHEPAPMSFTPPDLLFLLPALVGFLGLLAGCLLLALYLVAEYGSNPHRARKTGPTGPR